MSTESTWGEIAQLRRAAEEALPPIYDVDEKPQDPLPFDWGKWQTLDENDNPVISEEGMNAFDEKYPVYKELEGELDQVPLF